jgi:hypothetical protein
MANGDVTQQTFRLEDYFVGHTRAWGIFQDRFGKLRQQFIVEVNGSWDADKDELTLVEDFVYSNGTTEQRTWTVTKTGDTTYEGRTSGIIGVAQIHALRGAVHLRYRLRMPMGGRPVALTFDDWMYRQDASVMINRASVTKFGFLLGTATICFQKGGNPGQAAA